MFVIWSQPGEVSGKNCSLILFKMYCICNTTREFYNIFIFYLVQKKREVKHNKTGQKMRIL
jgi:hypothetical protein